MRLIAGRLRYFFTYYVESNTLEFISADLPSSTLVSSVL